MPQTAENLAPQCTQWQAQAARNCPQFGLTDDSIQCIYFTLCIPQFKCVHTEKSDYITKSCNVAELPGKSCWIAGSLLTGFYHASCCCTGLQSMGLWTLSGTGLYHVIINDYVLLHQFICIV